MGAQRDGGRPDCPRQGQPANELRLRAIPDSEKPSILKAYLERFKLTVQRYFPIPAGSPAVDFEPIAERYPVFELLPDANSEA